jgi:hypothetical protein
VFLELDHPDVIIARALVPVHIWASKLTFFSDFDVDGFSFGIGVPGRPGQCEPQPQHFEIYWLFMEKPLAPQRSSGPENVEEC